MSPLVFVHVGSGILGMFAGFVALFARKGALVHRSVGTAFFISMLVLSLSGAYLAAFVKPNIGNVLGGVLTFYMVATGWQTIRRTEGRVGLIEVGLLLVALGYAAGAISMAFQARNSATGLAAGYPAPLYFFFASIALLSATGDLRMLLGGGVVAAKRIARHLWRMCVALLIATFSFFFGRSGIRAVLFTEPVRKTHLPEVPVVIICVVMLYWVWRVVFTNEYKRSAT
jgi:hypothetical protein